MTNKTINPNFVDCGTMNGDCGRGDCQIFWHGFFGTLLTGFSILDVGAGLGHSKQRLSHEGTNTITTQDIAPGQIVDITTPIEEIAENCYDIVTAFDVIEHVVEDEDFLRHMVRIATKSIIITTPNWNVSKCFNKYHAREYTPQELVDMLDVYGFAKVTYYSYDTRNQPDGPYDYDGFLQHCGGSPAHPSLESFLKTPNMMLAVMADIT